MSENVSGLSSGVIDISGTEHTCAVRSVDLTGPSLFDLPPRTPARDLLVAEATAKELPPLNLTDALELTILIARKEPRQHPRVATRWLLRYLEECEDATIGEAALVAACLASGSVTRKSRPRGSSPIWACLCCVIRSYQTSASLLVCHWLLRPKTRCGMSDQFEARLSRVMIRCPESGEGIPAGMRIDAASFETGNLSDQMAKCPHCGQVHAWSTQDAWLEDIHEQACEPVSPRP